MLCLIEWRKVVMNRIRILLCMAGLALCILRAEEPTPPVPNGTAPKAAAGTDWSAIFRNLQSRDSIVQDTAVTDYLQALDEQAKKSKKPYFANAKTSFASKDARERDAAVMRIAALGKRMQGDKKHFT